MTPDWLALVLTLPTSPSAVRVRIWRALKASGCGALRDGVYLMPASARRRATCSMRWPTRCVRRAARPRGSNSARATRNSRCSSRRCSTVPRSTRHSRSNSHGQRRALRSATEVAGRRLLRSLAQKLDALQAHRLLPRRARRECGGRAGRPARGQAKRAGRPASRALKRRDGSSGATRPTTRAGPGRRVRRPWVDRLASAWLDPPASSTARARFVWLKSTARAAEGRARLRLRRRDVQPRRRQGDVRGDRGELRPRRRRGAAAGSAKRCTTSTSAARRAKKRRGSKR